MQNENEVKPEEKPQSEANEAPAEAVAPEDDRSDVKPPSDPLELLSATITALQAELSAEREKREKAERDFLYLQAEFQNFRRRKEEEFISQQKYAAGELIKGLLPILDNFERAMAAAERHQSYEKLIGGVQGTQKQFVAFLEKSGVTPIEAVGKEFDPNFHEAVGHAEESEFPANTVTEEMQRGYLLHDRVLRPALVKVAS